MLLMPPLVMLLSLALLGSEAEAAPANTDLDARIQALSAKLSVHEMRTSTCSGGGGPSCGNWFTTNHCGVGETCGHSDTRSWCCPVGYQVPKGASYVSGYGDGPGHCYSVDAIKQITPLAEAGLVGSTFTAPCAPIDP